MIEQSDPQRGPSRAIVLTIGALLGVVVIVVLVVVYGNTTEVQDDAEPFSLRIYLPDTDHEQVIRFGPPDVAGLKLDQATWPSQQGRSYDLVRVDAGFIPTVEEPQYCLADDVVDDATGDVVVEAGTCVDHTPIDVSEPPAGG